MRKVLTCSTALSVALGSFSTLPARAQSLAADGSVIGPDGTVLCVPTADAPCDLEAITKALAEAAAAEAAAAEAAAQAAAEAAAAEAAAQAAAEAAAAEAAAQAAADAAAAEAAAQAAAEAAAAEAAAQAAADAAAAEAAAQAAADAAAAEAAAQAAADAAAAEAAAQAAADAAAAEAAAQAAADAAAAEAAAQAAAEASADDAPSAVEDTVPEETAPEAPTAIAEPVDIPVPEPEAVESLAEILATPSAVDGDPGAAPAEGEGAAAPAVPGEALAEDVLPAAAAAALLATDAAGSAATPGAAETAPVEPPVMEDPIAVVSEIISEADARTSSEDFVAAPVVVDEGRKSGLSDLEKVGLIALGALVVGAIINEGKKDQKEVVANSGDRVIVLNPDGTYDIYKDDDAVLRRPGVQAVTETYRDGSTRTIVTRADGTQVVTIRDASGRVLRRSVYDRYGVETVLIDDLYYEEPIVVSELPRPRPDRVTISTADEDAALKAELAAIEAEGLGRKFSLRQIREIPEVRALAATIEVDSITFDSGSPAIRSSEARKLADLGRLMQDLLADNPAHVFLIEGHTDAVGSAASNLLLSDRRAESLALALTEYFDIPPENLVVQGYGESELKIDTQGDERANRRVVVRLITPLMRTADLR